MPDLLNYRPYMEIAIEEASKSLREGNHGFGAVIIKDGQIISQSHDQDETKGDSTLHAETNAIKFASKILGKNLHGCKLISTHEPCPMCAGAIVWSGVSKVVYGYSIKDSVEQKRKRISLSAEELFERAGAKIEVRGGLMKEECSILYNESVLQEIKNLRGINEEGLKKSAALNSKKRMEWYNKTNQKIKFGNENILDDAYLLFLTKLGINEEEAPVVNRTEKEIVIHSKNFCPTLEACKILGLDTSYICKHLTEKSMNDLLKLLNPSLSFTRNYSRLRPRTEFCEEKICLSGDFHSDKISSLSGHS